MPNQKRWFLVCLVGINKFHHFENSFRCGTTTQNPLKPHTPDMDTLHSLVESRAEFWPPNQMYIRPATNHTFSSSFSRKNNGTKGNMKLKPGNLYLKKYVNIPFIFHGYCIDINVNSYVPGPKLLMLGMVIPPLMGNPHNGDINPYCWVDDRPLVYGNNMK